MRWKRAIRTSNRRYLPNSSKSRVLWPDRVHPTLNPTSERCSKVTKPLLYLIQSSILLKDIAWNISNHAYWEIHTFYIGPEWQIGWISIAICYLSHDLKFVLNLGWQTGESVHRLLYSWWLGWGYFLARIEGCVQYGPLDLDKNKLMVSCDGYKPAEFSKYDNPCC